MAGGHGECCLLYLMPTYRDIIHTLQRKALEFPNLSVSFQFCALENDSLYFFPFILLQYVNSKAAMYNSFCQQRHNALVPSMLSGLLVILNDCSLICNQKVSFVLSRGDSLHQDDKLSGEKRNNRLSLLFAVADGVVEIFYVLSSHVFAEGFLFFFCTSL